MVEEHLISLGLGLVTTGVTTGTTIAASEARTLLRQREISEELEVVATEFQRAFKRAIEDEDARRDTGELTEVTDDWGAVVAELIPSENEPREREQLELVFTDEETAVERVAEAIATVQGYDLARTPQLREQLEAALIEAYRAAVAEFEQSIAGTELIDVFQAETGLVLLDRLETTQRRLDRLQAHLTEVLEQPARNEGFRQLTPAFLARREPDPESCWRTGFSLWDVGAGIPAERAGIDETPASVELFERLQTGNDQLVVGRAGAGKSTLCKQTAIRWARTDETGPVFYRESGGGHHPFGSTDALETAIERAEGHVLVAVEDVVRPAAEAVLSVRELLADDETVTFLFDARESELESFAEPSGPDTTAGRRHARQLSGVTRYPLPVISKDDLWRMLRAFEEATGRPVGRELEPLYDDLRSASNSGFGVPLLLAFYLPSDGTDETPTGLEANIAARYGTLMRPDSEDALRDLTRFDAELLADVGVMVNLLNASGIGVRPELVHALGHHYGHGIERHDEIADIRAALEGWFLYPAADAGGSVVRTTHELWSTLYLRRLAEDHIAQQTASARRERSEPHLARCLDALFALVYDRGQREALEEEFPGSRVVARLEAEPESVGEEYLESVFELAQRWPVLAPLFGTTQTARYELPTAVTDETRRGAIMTRGHAHRLRGAYNQAETEYETALERARAAGDRREEAACLEGLGLIAAVRGNYETAEQYHEQSLALARELGDREAETVALGNLGHVAQSRGDFETAQEYHQQSLTLSRDRNDREGEMVSLSGLGSVAHTGAEDDTAQEYYERALEIAREIDDLNGEATILHNLGNLAVSRDSYTRAEELFERSLKIKRDIGDRRGEARSLGELAMLAENREDYQTARDTLEQSLEIQQAIGDREGAATTLGNLGTVALGEGDLEAAEQYHQRSLDISRDLGDDRGEAVSLANLGEVAAKRGENETADERYQTALDRLEGIGALRKELEVIDRRARHAATQGDRETAIEWCDRGLERIEAAATEDPTNHLLNFQALRARMDRSPEATVDLYFHVLGEINVLEKEPDRGPDDLVLMLRELWERREVVSPDQEEFSFVMCGGVLWAAHVRMGDYPDVPVDADDILEEISPHDRRLTAPILALYDRLVSGSIELTPAELRAVGKHDEEFEEFECRAVATVLEILNSTG